MFTDPKSGAAIENISANSVVDDVDRRLLVALNEDPRQSKSALARRAGLSTPTVSSRIARLERLGVIRGYRLDLDPAALGYLISAWVRVRPGPGQLAKVVELAERTPEISECHRVTGDDCFLLHVHAPSLSSLEHILDRFLLHGQTTSTISVSSPILPRNPPVLESTKAHAQ
ncbi:MULTISPECIES: Lrp/AsnC family transcriptional regulator [Prauserella salsuginis group]|uniref:Lrp/AsnC family transcriptional regulator n=1 Tax=Prauserella salsuginis TaxID=387889 RepID=A0ABW6G885_9PSEU|nr:MULTISPECIES: Lrp/AsnC family transcriptional regulator [Prauserella salsuginis group]MCR3721751.1 Lrp/AsnC family transcriptional regulator, leucine-responsive regulatory protein [Prauserella flava]MCR3734442.1 Lrp/AsnC family transcriptional regulator, leucine-responsive regulatory protein [Prauserella salsuginis]